MNVSRAFLRDFAYLANLYAWSPADIDEIKAQTRESTELRDYWTTLAGAHRAGYHQTQANGFLRLGQWQQNKPPEEEKE